MGDFVDEGRPGLHQGRRGALPLHGGEPYQPRLHAQALQLADVLFGRRQYSLLGGNGARHLCRRALGALGYPFGRAADRLHIVPGATLCPGQPVDAELGPHRQCPHQRRRLFEILETEADLENGPLTLSPEVAHGTIEWCGVSFHYRSEMPVLRSIDLRVEPGMKVAVVGPTGAGKSTMLGLLPRFFDPSTGSVTIDGVDFREFSLKSLRRQIAMVQQPPLIFPISVRDNLAYGRPDATPTASHAPRAKVLYCGAAKKFPRISKSRASPKEPIPLTARKLERRSL